MNEKQAIEILKISGNPNPTRIVDLIRKIIKFLRFDLCQDRSALLIEETGMRFRQRYI